MTPNPFTVLQTYNINPSPLPCHPSISPLEHPFISSLGPTCSSLFLLCRLMFRASSASSLVLVLVISTSLLEKERENISTSSYLFHSKLPCEGTCSAERMSGRLRLILVVQQGDSLIWLAFTSENNIVQQGWMTSRTPHPLKMNMFLWEREVCVSKREGGKERGEMNEWHLTSRPSSVLGMKMLLHLCPVCHSWFYSPGKGQRTPSSIQPHITERHIPTSWDITETLARGPEPLKSR